MELNWIALFVALPIALLTILLVIMTRESARESGERKEGPLLEERFLWSVSIALAILFLVASVPKLVGVDAAVGQFNNWGYSDEFMVIVGVIEMFAAVLLLFPPTAGFAAGILSVEMVGAVYTHLVNGEYGWVLVPLIALAGLVYVAYERLPRVERRGFERRTA